MVGCLLAFGCYFSSMFPTIIVDDVDGGGRFWWVWLECCKMPGKYEEER